MSSQAMKPEANKKFSIDHLDMRCSQFERVRDTRAADITSVLTRAHGYD